MRRRYSFARGSHIPAATLNRIMDEQSGLVRASGAPSAALALLGEDGRYWTTDTGLADHGVAVVDASVDWRSRSLRGVFTRLTAANERLHDSAAWKRNDPASSSAIVVRTFDDAWTGSNAAPITATPTIGAGVFAVMLDDATGAGDGVWLFARSTDGALCLLNETNATLHAELRVWGSGVTASAGTAPTVPGLLAGEVETADATWTPVPGCTATLAASSAVTFRGIVSAIRDDGTEGGGWTFSVRARRGASGGVTVGTAVFVLAECDDETAGVPDWHVRVQASGNDVAFQVQGVASKTITWRVEVDSTEAKI